MTAEAPLLLRILYVLNSVVRHELRLVAPRNLVLASVTTPRESHRLTEATSTSYDQGQICAGTRETRPESPTRWPKSELPYFPRRRRVVRRFLVERDTIWNKQKLPVRHPVYRTVSTKDQACRKIDQAFGVVIGHLC